MMGNAISRGRLTAMALAPDGSTRPADRYDAPMLMAGEARVQFHVMIKPVGSACNLNCAYCFYLSKATLADGPGCGRMSDETIEALIQQYIAGVTADEVVFTWQGGEPTLAGVDFYRKVIELQKKHARPGQRIQNDLQTNGTLLDEEWCRFLQENYFLVGLSIDGPKKLHDAYRVAKDSSPTFDQVMRGVRLLKQFGIPFNTLTCVNRLNARQPLDVYRFLRREVGSTRIQFTPVVEPVGFETAPPRPDGVVTEWSVDPDDWGYFLCKTFDEWLARDLGKVYVNQFETLVSQHLGLGPQLCTYGEYCGKGVAVEHDGSVYACDHYVYPKFRVGRLSDGKLAGSVFSRGQVKFGYAKSEFLPRQCRECEYLSDCRGECPKNRILRTPDGEPGLNYLCAGLKRFYAHALPEVERIVGELRKEPMPAV